ncbi:isopentenyl-diphosphate Delta-isomerase [Fluviicola sp.]|uniref:isopentenyl-diphosphate Delta-isomerase n=1 Tax=Fluviicola sp. TaxID=1917219 RepID=UPI0028226F17|nr:isopentenyl-diphosphate Delta-isomerase [Fluviicola sp.]MDR0801279.1 isopentenyl-diphosphate Delta-isomerase [Fluviicola sp.]
METVVLVNEQDEVLGLMEKMEAHRKGILHRAFSVFIHHNGKVLLQQRSLNKYHSAGLWTNTCCSHPRINESLTDAGSRRLMEEMGISCTVKPHFHFIYRAQLDSGLIENELDYILFGSCKEIISPNPDEVMDYKWMDWNELTEDIARHPERYTSWLQILISDYRQNIEEILFP